MYARVLVGTDGSERASRAVESAAKLARRHGAELTVGHAFSVRGTAADRRAWLDAPEEVRWRLSPGTIAEATVASAIERARSMAGDDLVVAGVCEPGRPAAVLIEAARRVDADVVVIGNRVRRIQREVCRRARCDVIIVDTTRPPSRTVGAIGRTLSGPGLIRSVRGRVAVRSAPFTSG